MGKHGPCYHCGVTNTPLWRNGPPEKPVLCNACGSRWRTKGTLENYAPLHARAEADEVEDYRVFKVKTLPSKYKEVKVLKRKNNYNFTEFEGIPLHHNQLFPRGFDEDTSNRSSSGSAISNTESCAQNGSADASDLTGPSQPIVWDTMVPSRKRTCFTRPKPSPVEKLTKDLYTIWNEQQSSCLSASSEEDLLLESDKPMVSVEIGHGSVLIRHPNSIAREEESEGSSLSIDNKRHAFSSQMLAYPALAEDMCAPHTQTPVYAGIKEEPNGRDEDQPEKLKILTHHNSPLCHIDIQDSKGKSVLAVKSNSVANFGSWDQRVAGADEIMKSRDIKTDKGWSLFCSDFGEEEDLLVDVRSNSSFPQAELLQSWTRFW